MSRRFSGAATKKFVAVPDVLDSQQAVQQARPGVLNHSRNHRPSRSHLLSGRHPARRSTPSFDR